MVFPQPKVPDFKKAMAPSSNFLMVVAVVTLIAIIVGGRVAFLCTVDSKQGREFRRQWKLQMKKMKGRTSTDKYKGIKAGGGSSARDKRVG
mmetsp:Transcript_78091/g.224260  ORF Transcript_78091/g.224260 Transcript_78091/m.224260 type:complete len:91 (-) Transcript_78091:82-354(-)